MNVNLPLALLLQDPAATEGAAEASGGFGDLMIPVLIIMGLFYVIMLGPERKQRKKREEMLNNLKKGQEVMTTGGMFGEIAAVSEDKITLLVSKGVRVKFSRSAIQGLAGEEQVAGDKKASGDKQIAEESSKEPETAETVKA